ncbi:MAG: ABC transporter substrate-binding protein [Janthinobacterium lividum]
MRRQAGAFAAFLCLLLLLVPGCGLNSADRSGGPVHVEVWSMWSGDEEHDFEDVLAYYNKTHPGVLLENLGAVDDPKTIRAIVAAAPPDLCTLAEPNYLGALAANKALQPLDDRFQAAGLKAADYTPSSLEQCRYNGHLYAIPYLLDCTALLYNKDVFKAAGLDPDKPPRTLEEMEADAQKITQHDAQGQLTRLGMRPPDAITLMALYGGGFLDPKTGQATADNPRNIEAAAFDKSLMDAQGGYEEVQSFSQGFGSEMGSFNPFFLGQIGMTFGGQWNTYWAYHYSPKTHYGIAPLPYPAAYPRQAGTVWLGSNPFCIPRGAKHSKEAWDFLVWSQTPDGQRRFAMSLHGIPNIRASLRDPALRTGEPWRPRYGQFMDLADSPNATFFPPMPVATLYQGELINAVDSVCYGHRSPSEALKAVQARVQREVSEYQ